LQLRHAAKVLILAAVLAACGAQQKQDEIAGCPSTRPDGVGPEGDVAGIQIILTGTGKILAVRRGEVPRADHLVTEFVDADGSVSIKFPWWTGPDAHGRLRVTGTSVDGRLGRVRGEYARAPRDFHPGYLRFPSQGCWKVTGRAGGSSLTFVIDVVDCVRRECADV
jgi:hypothetical protein